MSADSVNMIVVLKDGSRRELALVPGQTVMQAAVDAGLPGIIGECGGSAMCATCHVYVEGGPVDALPALSDTEDGMLDATASERLVQSRLSCQIVATAALDGLVLRLPELQS